MGVLQWIRAEAKGVQVPLLMLSALLVDGTFDACVLGVSSLLGILPDAQPKLSILILSRTFLIAFPLTVLVEEILFRLPLAILVWKKWPLERILFSVLGLSLLFGLMHGGIWHVFSQGVGGMIYSVLFLKCGGFQGRYIKAVLVTFLTHLIFNSAVLFLYVMTGGSHI